MDLRGFLNRVLPPTGNSYFGAAINGNKKLQQTRLNSIAALEQYIKSNIRNDVYFATGTYNGKRDSKSTEQKKAFYLDVDCGVGDKYPDKQTAARELLSFCANNFVKPTLIVDSGGGLHAYWVLDDPIPLARWVRSAEALKRLCIEHGFKADPTPTADAARIMRAPFSMNYKNAANPRFSKIIFEQADDYTVEQIEAKLITAGGSVLALAVNNDDLFANNLAAQPRSATRMVEHCPMFADAIQTGGAGLPEMLWAQQLHVLAYCDDGEDYAHAISKGYEGYAFAETQIKWNQRLAAKDKAGPTLCSTFSKFTPLCASCPHNGFVTTPLQLGTERDPTIPYPFDQDDRGVFYQSEEKDERGLVHLTRRPVFDYRIEGFDVVYGSEATVITFDAKPKGKPAHHVEIDYADLMEKRNCIAKLSSYHVIISDNEYNGFRNLMSAWTKRMQAAKVASKSWSKLGWSDEGGFVLGETVILPNNKRQSNFHPDKQLVQMYEIKGERDPWVDLSKLLTRQHRHAIDALLMTSFASPLLRWTRDPSAVMAFVSAKSGSGKSTAMQLAQAVWGSPKKGINQLDDTHASVLKKISFANNLPAYWDEIRAKTDVDRFLSMIFQMTGGKERSRLSANVELRETGSWSTILTVASNESIADHAEYAAKDTEAGRVRVFEITVPTITETEMDRSINSKMIEVASNYGVVGEEYAKFLVDNQEAVGGIVTKLYEKLSVDLLRDNSERFWLTSVTVLLAAAMLTNKLNLTEIDLSSFKAWLVEQMESQRRESSDAFGSGPDHAIEVVLSFLNKFRSQVLVCERLPTKTGVGRTINTPVNNEIVATIATLDNGIRIKYDLFRQWMYDNTLGSPSMVINELKLAYNAQDKRANLTGGAGFTLNHNRTRVIELRLDPILVQSLDPGSVFEESID